MSRRRYVTVRCTPEELYAYKRQTFWHRLAKVLGVMLMGIIFYAMLMLILVNWVSQCGEVIYHQNGTWENGTCHPDWLFFNYEPQKGTWK